MQLYAITDRSLVTQSDGAPPVDVTQALAALALRWAESGVAYIQIREKDLSTDALATLSEAIVAATSKYPVKILVNGTPRVAAAAGASGVHLPAGWTAEAIAAARNVFQQRHEAAVVSVACHSGAEAVRARDLGADLALLSPVYEKRLRQSISTKGGSAGPTSLPEAEFKPGMGLAVFREACSLAAPLPVFALGGVTAANARQCVEAGAMGIAAIRLFLGRKEAWLPLLS